MQVMKIPKKSGGFRTVAIPSRARKQACRDLLLRLHDLVREFCDPQIVHGFAEMRSPVTNALRHTGKRFTVSFDLQDFFDHVRVREILSKPPSMRHIKNLNGCFVLSRRECEVVGDKLGIARQGLPTSPLVANLAANEMDRQIAREFPSVVYTRYADDLSFSFDDPELIGPLRTRIPQITKDHGFPVNPNKTTVQDGQHGRRIICGVAVDDTIHPTRAAKRKLRAAQHNALTGQTKTFPVKQWARYKRHGGKLAVGKFVREWLKAKARGLEEWCALKLPKMGRRTLAQMSGLDPADMLKRLSER